MMWYPRVPWNDWLLVIWENVPKNNCHLTVLYFFIFITKAMHDDCSKNSPDTFFTSKIWIPLFSLLPKTFYPERVLCFKVRKGRGSPRLFWGLMAQTRVCRAIPRASPPSPNSELTTGAKLENYRRYISALTRDQEEWNLFRLNMQEKFSFNSRKLAGSSEVLSLAVLEVWWNCV